jgi:transposase-like protein
MAEKRQQRSYTQDVRDIAVEAYHVTGSPSKVSEAMGIPHGTITTWTKNNQDMEKEIEMDKEKGKGEVSDTLDLLKKTRLENKIRLAEKGYEIAMNILKELEGKMEKASFKVLSIGYGIIMDKTALAAGDVTARSETVQRVDREDLLNAAQSVSEKVKTLPRKKAV